MEMATGRSPCIYVHVVKGENVTENHHRCHITVRVSGEFHRTSAKPGTTPVWDETLEFGTRSGDPEEMEVMLTAEDQDGNVTKRSRERVPLPRPLPSRPMDLPVRFDAGQTLHLRLSCETLLASPSMQPPVTPTNQIAVLLRQLTNLPAELNAREVLVEVLFGASTQTSMISSVGHDGTAVWNHSLSFVARPRTFDMQFVVVALQDRRELARCFLDIHQLRRELGLRPTQPADVALPLIAPNGTRLGDGLLHISLAAGGTSQPPTPATKHLHVRVRAAKHLPCHIDDKAFVDLRIGDVGGRTAEQPGPAPKWNQVFTFPVVDETTDHLELTVTFVGNADVSKIGRQWLQIGSLTDGAPLDVIVPLFNGVDGQWVNNGSELHIEMTAVGFGRQPSEAHESAVEEEAENVEPAGPGAAPAPEDVVVFPPDEPAAETPAAAPQVDSLPYQTPLPLEVLSSSQEILPDLLSAYSDDMEIDPPFIEICLHEAVNLPPDGSVQVNFSLGETSKLSKVAYTSMRIARWPDTALRLPTNSASSLALRVSLLSVETGVRLVDCELDIVTYLRKGEMRDRVARSLWLPHEPMLPAGGKPLLHVSVTPNGIVVPPATVTQPKVPVVPPASAAINPAQVEATAALDALLNEIFELNRAQQHTYADMETSPSGDWAAEVSRHRWKLEDVRLRTELTTATASNTDSTSDKFLAGLQHILIDAKVKLLSEELAKATERQLALERMAKKLGQPISQTAYTAPPVAMQVPVVAPTQTAQPASIFTARTIPAQPETLRGNAKRVEVHVAEAANLRTSAAAGDTPPYVDLALPPHPLPLPEVSGPIDAVIANPCWAERYCLTVQPNSESRNDVAWLVVTLWADATKQVFLGQCEIDLGLLYVHGDLQNGVPTSVWVPVQEPMQLDMSMSATHSPRHKLRPALRVELLSLNFPVVPPALFPSPVTPQPYLHVKLLDAACTGADLNTTTDSRVAPGTLTASTRQFLLLRIGELVLYSTPRQGAVTFWSEHFVFPVGFDADLDRLNLALYTFDNEPRFKSIGKHSLRLGWLGWHEPAEVSVPLMYDRGAGDWQLDDTAYVRMRVTAIGFGRTKQSIKAELEAVNSGVIDVDAAIKATEPPNPPPQPFESLYWELRDDYSAAEHRLALQRSTQLPTLAALDPATLRRILSQSPKAEEKPAAAAKPKPPALAPSPQPVPRPRPPPRRDQATGTEEARAAPRPQPERKPENDTFSQQLQAFDSILTKRLREFQESSAPKVSESTPVKKETTTPVKPAFVPTPPPKKSSPPPVDSRDAVYHQLQRELEAMRELQAAQTKQLLELRDPRSRAPRTQAQPAQPDIAQYKPPEQEPPKPRSTSANGTAKATSTQRPASESAADRLAKRTQSQLLHHQQDQQRLEAQLQLQEEIQAVRQQLRGLQQEQTQDGQRERLGNTVQQTQRRLLEQQMFQETTTLQQQLDELRNEVHQRTKQKEAQKLKREALLAQHLQQQRELQAQTLQRHVEQIYEMTGRQNQMETQLAMLHAQSARERERFDLEFVEAYRQDRAAEYTEREFSRRSRAVEYQWELEERAAARQRDAERKERELQILERELERMRNRMEMEDREEHARLDKLEEELTRSRKAQIEQAAKAEQRSRKKTQPQPRLPPDFFDPGYVNAALPGAPYPEYTFSATAYPNPSQLPPAVDTVAGKQWLKTEWYPMYDPS
eukprot:TRINITY_DN6587_c0_g1_i1.p1 TRINITY_DN6587_c0_g1~~TRINITY_DN6587_c0_g1_i1.p1  ORF type:complete len:1700 (-),score=284.03 TRINITY_DN6587_c0_g1_i1:3-5102(-)